MTLAIIFDSVGVGEWFVLLAVILIVVGPKRLPSSARKFGQYYSKFRRAADAFKRQLMEMDTELTNTVRQATQEFNDAANDLGKAAEEATADLTGDESASAETASDIDYGDYGDYGGYNPDEEAAAPAQPEPPPAPETKTKPDLASVKITVSPAPTADKKA